MYSDYLKEHYSSHGDGNQLDKNIHRIQMYLYIHDRMELVFGDIRLHLNNAYLLDLDLPWKAPLE